MAWMPKQLPCSAIAAAVVLAVCVLLSLTGAAAADDSASALLALPSAGVEQSGCPGADGGSSTGYAGATGAQAEDLFTEHFPCIIDQLAADPPAPQGAAATLADGTGSVPSSDSATGPLPLRTSDGSPVDLSLQATGDGYEPANPLVDLTLPPDLGQAVPVGDGGIAIETGATNPEGAASAAARPLDGQGLFYVNAAPATDVMLAPISAGLETTYQLRGPESPERLRMGLDLPAGAGLQAAIDGGAQVVEGGQPVASLFRPVAIDANGNPVAAAMSVDGSGLVIDVPHSDPGTAYPIAVTASAGSFASAAEAQAATVAAGMNGVAPSKPTVDINGTPTTEGQQSANLGTKVLRYSIDWCGVEPRPGVYAQGALQAVVNFVYNAHQTSPAQSSLVALYTSAPDFARTDAMKAANGHTTPCTNQQDDGGAASIASGSASDYGLAMKKIAWCLNGDARCNDDLNSGSVTMHGQMLDQGWVYGFEAGNEVNTSNYWQTGQDTITRTQANIYWSALAAAASAVHTYRSGALVGSAGLAYGGPDGYAFGADKVDGTTYLDQVLSNGGSGANAYSIHPYGAGLHPDMVTSNGVRINNNVYQDTGWTRVLLISYGYGYAKPIWITEVGVDADPSANDTGNVTSNDEGQQFYDLYYTWENSIRAICSSDNVPLATFYTFKDPDTYGTGQKFYAGFAKIKPDHLTVDYSKAAYYFFNLEQYFTFNTCTG